jgi:hypothetical protein
VHTALNQQLQPTIEEARNLTRSIQDMELELAMLRNSKTEEERMTVDEASEYLDEQVSLASRSKWSSYGSNAVHVRQTLLTQTYCVYVTD